MENLEQGQEKMKGDIDELRGSMAKIMEMLQALTTKEDQPQCIVISEIYGLSVELQPTQRLSVSWPEFGLPPNYSPPFMNTTGVRPPTQQVVQILVVTEQ